MAHILLVDDSVSVLELLRSWLVADGHQVTAVSDSSRIRQVLTGTRFDLVVTDIYMPGVDGMEILTHARKSLPGVPCIAMSSNPGPVNCLQAAKALGAALTLTKPIQPEQFLAAVHRALAARQPQTPAPRD